MKCLVENPKNKPIVDWDEDVVLEITSSHVRRAVPLDPTKCAAAICGKETVCGVIKATINKSVSYLEFKDVIARLKTTEALARELISIDRGAVFAPGTYYLKSFSKTSQLGAPRKNGKPRGKKDGSRPRVTPHVTVMVRGA